MSEELRVWLKAVKKRRDRALTEFGDDHAFADVALDCVNADMSDLIAKVEELAEAFGDVPDLLREIADNARNGNAGEMERLVCTAAYLEDQAGLMDDALRAPGGGERE